MIKPTIGRVVWFHPEQGAEIHSGETQAALVAKVLNDRLVNLAVFDDRGRPYPAIEIELWQGDGKRPKDAYCEWPVREDAAKTEAPDTVKGSMAG